ncbi:hypothetical protein PIB30_010078 [Stylosanthes scabra]|uniref:Uncharacterized protein n=1 Tax=Stylosanthes scabra TaxID=79078 RepID=A0ABU6X5H2_9FABA|nr:hypothetical protein [Stylosanthes scabra]
MLSLPSENIPRNPTQKSLAASEQVTATPSSKLPSLPPLISSYSTSFHSSSLHHSLSPHHRTHPCPRLFSAERFQTLSHGDWSPRQPLNPRSSPSNPSSLFSWPPHLHRCILFVVSPPEAFGCTPSTSSEGINKFVGSAECLTRPLGAGGFRRCSVESPLSLADGVKTFKRSVKWCNQNTGYGTRVVLLRKRKGREEPLLILGKLAVRHRTHDAGFKMNSQGCGYGVGVSDPNPLIVAERTL